jgi:hypothetical protein
MAPRKASTPKPATAKSPGQSQSILSFFSGKPKEVEVAPDESNPAVPAAAAASSPFTPRGSMDATPPPSRKRTHEALEAPLVFPSPVTIPPSPTPLERTVGPAGEPSQPQQSTVQLGFGEGLGQRSVAGCMRCVAERLGASSRHR